MQKVIKVVIRDMGTEKHFNVRLFGAMEGIDFVDTLAKMLLADRSKISIKSVLGDLLPLASYVGSDGTSIIDDSLSLNKIDSYFENPMAVIELGLAILEHQMIFIKESEVFRKFSGDVRNLFNMPTSDSQMPSEIL